MNDLNEKYVSIETTRRCGLSRLPDTWNQQKKKGEIKIRIMSRWIHSEKMSAMINERHLNYI